MIQSDLGGPRDLKCDRMFTFEANFLATRRVVKHVDFCAAKNAASKHSARFIPAIVTASSDTCGELFLDLTLQT